MTMPFERKSAVNQTRKFLINLSSPSKTPRVPKHIREQARALLKHYPSAYYMDVASEESPYVFGDYSNSRDEK